MSLLILAAIIHLAPAHPSVGATERASERAVLSISPVSTTGQTEILKEQHAFLRPPSLLLLKPGRPSLPSVCVHSVRSVSIFLLSHPIHLDRLFRLGHPILPIG